MFITTIYNAISYIMAISPCCFIITAFTVDYPLAFFNFRSVENHRLLLKPFKLVGLPTPPMRGAVSPLPMTEDIYGESHGGIAPDVESLRSRPDLSGVSVYLTRLLS